MYMKKPIIDWLSHDWYCYWFCALKRFFFYLFSCKLCMKSCLNRSSKQGRNHSITHLITSVSLNMVLMVLSWESLVFRPSFKKSSDHFTACQSSHTFRKAVALAFLHLYLSCKFLWVLVLFFFLKGKVLVLNWSLFFFMKGI